MMRTFLGIWSYLIFVVAIDVFVNPPDRVIRLALLPAAGMVVAGVWLQFSARCPSCGYRLGRQSRLVVPERCRSCGASLRVARY